MDQAVQMAQMKGASSLQIEQLKRRIQELNMSKTDTTTNRTTKNSQKSNLKKEVYSEKAIIEESPVNKRIFGFQFFNSEKLTFEPPVNIPTPQNYVLGIDDELTISIWGASQQTYQLTIDTNGAVNIPDIGPIYVSEWNSRKQKN